jgi:hypothetical protein
MHAGAPSVESHHLQILRIQRPLLSKNTYSLRPGRAFRRWPLHDLALPPRALLLQPLPCLYLDHHLPCGAADGPPLD